MRHPVTLYGRLIGTSTGVDEPEIGVFLFYNFVLDSRVRVILHNARQTFPPPGDICIDFNRGYISNCVEHTTDETAPDDIEVDLIEVLKHLPRMES